MAKRGDKRGHKSKGVFKARGEKAFLSPGIKQREGHTKKKSLNRKKKVGLGRRKARTKSIPYA